MQLQEIRKAIRDEVLNLIGEDSFDEDTSFFELGLTSLHVLDLVEKLSSQYQYSR